MCREETAHSPAPEIFRHNSNELCADYKHCTAFTPRDGGGGMLRDIRGTGMRVGYVGSSPGTREGGG